MKGLRIRRAVARDLSAINDIYNYYVTSSTCTYQEEPDSPSERAKWFGSHDARHPVIVAEMGGEVVGWACLSPFHPRCAYRYTVEDSVYVRHDMHRKGIGERLLRELVDLGRRIGHRSIVAVISADQAPSIALHRKLGFVSAGRLRKVGYKFERWLDVAYMQLLLRKRPEGRSKK